MRTKIIVYALIGLLAFSAYGKVLQLVENGKATAKIILLPNASPSERLAAQELAAYIKKISGAELPVQANVTADSIVLGTLDNLKDFPPEMKRRLTDCKKGDAFYIKTVGDKVYIIGKKPIGTLYGTYTFLEKLGVSWFFPGELGEYCPKKETIKVTAIDDFQEPVMTARVAALHAASYNFRNSNMWCARQKMRPTARPGFRWFSGCSDKEAEFLNTACDFSAKRGGHMIFEASVPDKLFKEHPEYFTLRKGKRKFGDRLQRCVSNPDVLKLVCEYGLKWCNSGKNHIFSICSHDRTDSWCECENCRKMGTVNGQFKITNLYHRFFSKVVDYILKQNPDAKIDVYFYIGYGVAPDDKSIKYTGKNVRGIYCTCYPHARCYAHPLFDPDCKQNKTCLEDMKEVLKICPQLYTYEYMPSAGIKYVPVWKVVGKDIKNMAAIGVDGFMDVTVPVNGILTGINLKKNPDNVSSWMARWPSLYVGAKLQWNPKLDANKLMDEAYDKYYGKAAPIMKKYHALRLKLWNSAPGHAYYGGAKRYGYCLTVPGAEKELNTYLAQAEKAAAGNALVLKRIKMDRYFLGYFWKTAAEKLKKLYSADKQIIPCPVKDKITVDGKLDEKTWLAARAVSGFLLLNKDQEPSEKNNFRVAYDKDNLYIGFVAMNDKAWSKVKADAVKRDSNDIFKDDHIEFEIAPPDSNDRVYHICINTRGTLYDSARNGGSVNMQYDSQAEIKICKLGNSFVYEIRLPLKPMKGTITPGKSWRLYALRTSTNLQPPENKETSSLDGNYPHRLMEFRKVIFGKNLISNGNFSLLAPYSKKTPEKIEGIPGKFPKSWGISSGYCKLEKKASGHAVSFNGGCIYSYLGKVGPGKVKFNIEAKGKGAVAVKFRTWMMKRDAKSGKTKRVNDRWSKLSEYKKLSDVFKQYEFEHTFADNESAYVYIYNKDGITVSNVNAAGIEK